MRNLLRNITLLVLAVMFAGCSGEPLPDVGTYYIISLNGATYLAEFVGEKDHGLIGTAYEDDHTVHPERLDIVMEKGLKKNTLVIEGQKYSDFSMQKYEAPYYKDLSKNYDYTTKKYKVNGPETVVYAQASGYWSSDPERGDSYASIVVSHLLDFLGKSTLNLDMDIYEPNDGGKKDRPVVLFLHGGAFFNGDKSDPAYVRMCRYFASIGYTAVSANYRLGFDPTDSSGAETAAYHAVQDAHAAIRFLIENKSEYHIDEDRIFVAGCSAGAIASLTLAYADESSRYVAQFSDEGPVNAVASDMDHDFQIRAVGNMWGALPELDLLKTRNIPIVSFHSVYDPVVPFDSGYPFESSFGIVSSFIFPRMFGSSSIDTRAEELDIYSKLHYYSKNRHNLYESEENSNELDEECLDEMMSKMASFFEEAMLPHMVQIKQVGATNQLYIDMTDVEECYWHIDDGAIMESHDGYVKIIPYFNYLTGNPTVTVSVRFTNGMTFTRSLQWHKLNWD